MKTVIDILGWTGSGLIILAYALTLVKNSEYLNYGKYLNLMGGILIAINCYYYQAIPPLYYESTMECNCNANDIQKPKD